MTNKIMIIGSPGSGKSTFARSLHEKTGIPLFYLDMIWHKPDKSTLSRAEFDSKLQDILKNDAWIIDGNYLRTIHERLKYADKVFLFDIPTEDCISGAEARIGKKRDDMPWIEDELDSEFRQYIEHFSSEQLPQIKKLLSDYKNNIELIVFNNREEATDYI